jgi:hypothetical protein
MGCGCCIVTFRDEVEDEILSYINLIKSHERNKKNLIYEIKKDLSKRAAVVEKYNYPYRKEDVKQTVNIYKNYIYQKFKGNVELLEDKIKSKEKKEKEIKNKIKEDDKKITLKDKINYNTIEFEKDKKLDENKKEQKINNNDNKKINDNIENIVSSKKEKESKNIDNAIKSDLQPMLEDKVRGNSEQDESENQKKSFDNIKNNPLPKEENSQVELKDKINNNNNNKNLRYGENEEEKEKAIEENNKDNIEKRSIKII